MSDGTIDEMARRHDFASGELAERARWSVVIDGGDGTTEPMRTADEFRDLYAELTATYAEHADCPVWCDECERWERHRSCQPCEGSGYGGPLRQSMDNILGWIECEHCAGDGREHAQDVVPDRPDEAAV